VGLAGCSERLATALSQSADPVAAPQRAADVLAAVAAADGSRLRDVWVHRFDALARILSTLCGAAPFFAPFLARHPGWLLGLAAEDLTTVRSLAEYTTLLTKELQSVPTIGQPDALRRFKYYQLARISVRELSPDIVPLERTGETLTELSYLADALLSRALDVAAARIKETYGPPGWEDPGGDLTRGFAVLGLGKLGSEELNFSSDVDLIYVYESPQESPSEESASPPQGGRPDQTPVEYFTRLAQEFGRVVSQPTPEGFLYRIDLDLRPEGSKGPLVVSSHMLADYYESWAATWERAAFMKARPVAGDRQFGWRVIRAIDPMIYRSTMDYESVAAVKELKDKIERAKGKDGDTFHVKLGQGGIRDVESVAQALQLLHGGRIPEVRGRPTETALVSLAEVGILSRPDAEDLLAAYRFLRRTENRLQMVAERQTHALPKERDDLRRLARSMVVATEEPVTAFEQILEHHRARTHQIFESLFQEAGTERILAMFARQVPKFLANPIMRPMMEDLAVQFGREIEASSDPLRAMNNLDRFIQGIGIRRFYYELLLDRPELIHRLVALFAASEYLSTHLASYPRLIEPIFDDPTVFLLPRTELEKNFEAIRREMVEQAQDDETETELEALRLAHHREIVNVGLLDLGGKVARADAEAALTEIAEICLARGLSLAASQSQRYRTPPPVSEQSGEFLVVGMGKLASRELTYGSDLDVIFLYDVERADEGTLLDAQEYFVRLAQKLIWALRTRTRAGICYDIDARLRPSGNQGMLVVSLAGFERYHATSAQVWERQALLRARPVAGSERLGADFERLRRRILRKPLPEDLEDEVHRIRARMETELARETAERHDFKTGRGGMLDIEAVVQFLQLRHGAAHDELLDVEPIATQLGHLERLALLDRAAALVLREGWEFLQRLSTRLRIVENRSISDLDEERGDLDALARGLGYTSRQRAGGARRALLNHYRHHTGAIRDVYCKILRVATQR